MISALTKAVSTVNSVFELNQATLSGSVDTIVVKQKDGSFKSTGFHVRFGKFQVLDCKDQIVKVEVNGHNTGLFMKLGPSGEAFFEHEIPAKNKSMGSSQLTNVSLNSSTNNQILSGKNPLKARESHKNSTKNQNQIVVLDENNETLSPNMIDKLAKKQRKEEVIGSFIRFFRPTTKPKDRLEVERLVSSSIDLYNDRGRLPHVLEKNHDVKSVDRTKRIDMNPNKENAPQNIVEGPSVEQLNDSNSNSSIDTSENFENQINEELTEKHTDHPKSRILTKQKQFNSKTNLDTSLASQGSIREKCVKKSIRLSSEQLEGLNLKPGVNTITYYIETKLQGKQKISANIYLWPYDAKIIVTDVDGTITKSDVLGAMLPMVGINWTQPGIAPLFANIRRNGYYVLYLTTRAIGQISFTRKFLDSVYQDETKLPEGPIISSGDQLAACFQREIVFSRPEYIKAAIMNDVKNLFPKDHFPFQAAFGNRENDAVAYRYAGIPLDRIFTVNPAGDVHHYADTILNSYAAMNTTVKDAFPCLNNPMAFCRR